MERPSVRKAKSAFTPVTCASSFTPNASAARRTPLRLGFLSARDEEVVLRAVGQTAGEVALRPEVRAELERRPPASSLVHWEET